MQSDNGRVAMSLETDFDIEISDRAKWHFDLKDDRKHLEKIIEKAFSRPGWGPGKSYTVAATRAESGVRLIISVNYPNIIDIGLPEDFPLLGSEEDGGHVRPRLREKIRFPFSDTAE